MILGTGAASSASPGDTVTERADKRHVYSSESPHWLRAVGALSVPGVKYQDGRRRHHREDCSATLVSAHPGREADTIVTAWHCLEFYQDLSQTIVFTLPQAGSEPVSREARRLADGGGIHADWAILRLHRPISAGEVTALAIQPGRADPVKGIITAGYSRDAGLGNVGESLTYDTNCQITHRLDNLTGSNCLAYKGASGGAVVQISPEGVPQLSGVISQGDGAGVLLFMPVEGFRGVLNRHL